MPDARAGSVVSLRRRIPALLTGMTLVGGAAAVARSTIERLHPHAEGRARLSMEVGDRPQPIAGLAPAAPALDASEPSGAVAESTEMQMCDAIVPLEGSASSDDAGAGVVHEKAGSERPLWPVDGAVTSPFGWRSSPDGGAREWHRGIDIKAAYGTPVHAAAEGTVGFAGQVEGYGALVIVDHGPVETWYAHLSTIAVRASQRIARGHVIGAVGGSGHTTGPHLHYEVRLRGSPVDPECVLAESTSRPGRRHQQRTDDCIQAVAGLQHPSAPMTARAHEQRRSARIGG